MLILSHSSAIIILYRGNKMATEFLIACILFTIQIIEILRVKILKQILLRLFCRERMGIKFYYRNIITAAKWDVFLLGGCYFVNTFYYLHYSFKQTTSACYFSIHQVNHSSDICRMNSRNLVLPNWIYLLFNAFTIFTQDLNTLL